MKMKNNFITDIYRKHKQLLLYLVFGFLTTLISIGTFALFEEALGIDPLIANIVSWTLAVLFAFVTNRSFVFEAEGGLLTQLARFYLARVATLLLEEGIIFVFVTRLCFDALLIKTLAQIIVIILNFVISKIFVFKK